MSRRKTVKVAQLEGRAQAFADIRDWLDWGMGDPVDKPTMKARMTTRLYEMEIEALRDMTKAQRAQEDEA